MSLEPTAARRRRRPALLLAVLLVATAPALGALGSPPASADGAFANEMLNQLNAYRASAGVGPLRLCANLSRSIQGHTDDMAANGYFSHTGLNGSTFIQRIEGAGYTPWSAVGENLANGQPDVASVLAAWKASPGHNANLLDARYTHLGVGLSYGRSGTPYWGQDFGAGGPCANGPIGTQDPASSPWPGVVTVQGWALEREAPTASIPVDVYLDGRGLGRFVANAPRPDVGAAFPGAGDAHGFRFNVPAAAGPHTVCVYAISVTGGLNTGLGCRGVVVADPNPIGSFDAASSPEPGRVRMTGWTFDPETTAPINVHVYADNRFAGQFPANATRTDVGAAFPGYGSNHGFDIRITIAGGPHTVCLYAINVGNGDHTPLGCRTVSVPNADPVGNFERADAVGGRLVVSGWALDPNTASPIQVHVYVGSTGTPLIASLSRPDVGAAFPGFGANHGFGAVLTVPKGTYNVCAYGINVSYGANRLLGCRTVTV